MRSKKGAGRVDSTLLKVVVEWDVVHAVEMERFPNDFVAIGEGVLGIGLPCALEVHAVVKNVVTEVEILMPD